MILCFITVNKDLFSKKCLAIILIYSFLPLFKWKVYFISKRPLSESFIFQVNDILSLSQPPDWCEVAKVLSESAARCLYDCLFDNYDNNKQRALKIIKDLPPHLLGIVRILSLLFSSLIIKLSKKVCSIIFVNDNKLLVIANIIIIL